MSPEYSPRSASPRLVKQKRQGQGPGRFLRQNDVRLSVYAPESAVGLQMDALAHRPCVG
jgi:hypothetical protein